MSDLRDGADGLERRSRADGIGSLDPDRCLRHLRRDRIAFQAPQPGDCYFGSLVRLAEIIGTRLSPEEKYLW